MKKDDKDNKTDWSEVTRELGRYGNLGFSMAFCVVIGAGLGLFADSKLGTSPWLLIAGCVLGLVSAFKVLYDIATKDGSGKK